MRLLRGVNVGVREIRWSETVYWQRQPDDCLDRFALRLGDIVIGMDRPWVGDGLRVAVIGEDDLPSLLLQRVAALRPDDRLREDYLFFLLQMREFVDYFTPDMTGVSVPHISPEQIAAFSFALPQPHEQGAIAAYLSSQLIKLERLVDEAQRAIALLQERRAALISAVVTGQIDVRGLAVADAEAA